MRLATITTVSVLIGAILCFASLWTAKQIAKSAVSRIEMAQLEIHP